MKVDLGQCAVCGAKNSKYVEKCYKCGAALPWAPDYVAPKNAPRKPVAAPDDANAKTVIVPPADDLNTAPNIEPPETPSVSAPGEAQVRSWKTIAFGLGLMALGLAMWAFLRTLRQPTTVAVAPTPIATTTALAPIVPALTEAPTLAPTTEETVAPTVVATPNTEVAAPVAGPTFDELYANLTQGTPRQQTLYWDDVKGQRISWRGEFVSLGNAANGPMIVHCKSAEATLKVTVNLDVTKPQTLAPFTPNESVPFEGILESHSAGEVTVNQGRAG